MRILPTAIFIVSMFLTLSSSVYANRDIINPKTVTIPYENTQIRSGPSIDDEIIDFAKKGTTFDVLAETIEWYKISNEKITGFVYKQLVDKQETATSKEINNKTIVIDAGHGGNDVGAIGASGIFEKNLTYKTALTLQQGLTTLGANVVLTRQKDQYISLASRTSLTNVTDADAFVSIHYNSVPQIPEATGIGTYYYQDYNQSLANNIQTELIKGTNANDRSTDFGDYQVLRQNFKPAVLIELGFISNEKKEQLLLSDAYQKQLVNGIISGLTKYFYE
ncbi:N-acetylmuramoyl-L-alanine amidase [Lentibacillus sp. Marseille-P4043]|uniref:N-acetylmuramoyl-L-alanine amidase n=1 Tax=Lentibacillus sp. Marseille-P4043 TaxID=2040293 RepID=UPI000D0AE86A|nr:N-acetylmuramoyl-L-alanine amidase [Lentibacillus sp. Marseille-P4043]